MPTFLIKITQWGIWPMIAKGFNNPAFRQIALIGLCIAGVYGTVSQCSSKRKAQEQLRVAQGQVITQQNIIKTATAIKKQTYVQQAKQLEKDSTHAASLPISVLESENDSLIRANREYIRKRAGNQSAVTGL